MHHKPCFSKTKIWQDMRKTMYIDTKRWDLSVLMKSLQKKREIINV